MKPFIVSVFFWLTILRFTPLVFSETIYSSAQYASRIWQTDDGLPHNSVTGICQTPDAYLWAGTPQGLVRFDGARFKVIDFSDLSPSPNHSIVDLLAAKSGTLWIATATDGIIEGSDGKFQRHDLPGGGNANRLRKIFETADGSVWIATEAGLFRSRGKQFAFVAPLLVSTLCNGGENIWVGAGDGLFLWKDEKLTPFRSGVFGTANAVTALCCDRQGQLWVGTSNFLAHLEDGQISMFDQKTGLAGPVSALHEDQSGRLWIGTGNGLYRLENARLVPQLDEGEKPFENIFCIREDREQNLWIGTSEGLAQVWRKPFRAITRDEGLSHGSVTSLLEDAAGNIWMATGGGLNCLRPTNNTIVVFNQANGDLGDSLLALCRRANGELWVSGEYQALFRFRERIVVNYTPAIDGLNCSIQALLEDAAGTLWLGTCSGLISYQNGVARRHGASSGVFGENVLAIVQDLNGDLWFGTDAGLVRRKDERFSTFTTADGLSTNAVLSIHQDRASDLWIGTAGGGLNRFRNGAFRAYRARDGLFNDSITEIVEDGFGNLWMSSVSGVFRVSKKDLEDFDRGAMKRIPCLSFGKSDGLPSPQCGSLAKPAAWKSSDGKLWFATSRGVGVIDPAGFQKPTPAPAIVIGEVLVDGRSLEPVDNSTTQIRVPRGRGEVEFHFAALSFHAPEKNRFRYKLEGVDVDWADSGTRPAAHYNNIRPGSYSFRVQGCNSEGVWNEKGASIGLVLLPHFWQTKWFIAVSIAAAILLVAGVARYLTRVKIRQEIRVLQQKHAIESERSRIAQDMHDDIGSQLTEIQLLSDLALKGETLDDVKRQVGKISSTTRDVVRGVGTIVWAINPKNDSLEDLAIYLGDYVQRILCMRNVHCRMEIPDVLPPISMSAAMRRDVFLTVKEATNNIVKHSGASEVQFQLCVEGDWLTIVVADNGKGFAPGELQGSGNGLVNMEKRIRNLGGAFDLTTQAGQGTVVRVRVPLRR